MKSSRLSSRPSKRHQVDTLAELGHEVRRCDRPAAEDLALLVLRGDDVFLGRLAERLDIDVLVEDCIADYQASLALDGRDFLLRSSAVMRERISLR